MNRTGLSRHLLALGGVLVSVAVSAQDAEPGEFALFEEIERAQSSNAAASTQARTRESRATAAQPVFTLVGTSRIGDRRHAIVKHMSGEEIVVSLQEDVATPIPEHTAYAIVDAQGRTLGIRYPGNVPCESFADQGVSCDGNIARLRLTNAEPLVQALTETADAAEQQVAAEAAAEDASRNPFELIRERARASQQGTDEANPQGQGFQPRRIDPAEVPPGYRVVSTPFGDRLVEE